MITDLIRKHGRRLLHHYLWPARLHSRLLDFDHYYKPPVNYLRVNLGAGPYFDREGWISADFLPQFKQCGKGRQVHVDLSKSLDKLPFENVGAYYISHTLEHFRLVDSARLLTSISKTMCDGSVLRIVVPDADLILDRARADDLEYFAPLFGYFKQIDSKKLNSIDMLNHLLCQPLCRYAHNSPVERDLSNIPIFSKDMLSKSNNEIIKFLNNHTYVNDPKGSLHISCYNAELLCCMLKDIGFGRVYKSAFMQSVYGPMREVPLFDGTHPWLSLYIEAIK